MGGFLKMIITGLLGYCSRLSHKDVVNESHVYYRHVFDGRCT